jgi:hypothetical protein
LPQQLPAFQNGAKEQSTTKVRLCTKRTLEVPQKL